MKIRELISQLSGYDEEIDVYIDDGSELIEVTSIKFDVHPQLDKDIIVIEVSL